MTSIQLNDTVAAAISAQAAAEGLTLQAYLEKQLLSGPPPIAPRMSVDEFDRLDEEATSGPTPAGTFSRAGIYRDHN